jgi:His/Glu/Gln/Arg/opine family amino acid ABC transporter permease subunit
MSHADVLTIFSGAWTTLLLSLAGIALGLPLGLGLALLRWGQVPLLNPLVAVYVSLLRATPLVTLVLLLFFALPSAGISMGPMTAGLLALTLNTAAFNCEVWRAALLDLPKDQIEAAQSVGMGRVLRLRRIVLPQIARTAMPGLINEMSLLIKLTPVLAVVGVVDITRAAVRIGAQTYEPLPPLMVALAIYVPIVFALVSAQRWVERRMARREAAA